MWKNKLRLSENETLRLDKSYEKGNLGQEEIDLYSILNEEGIVTGSVRFTDHVAIKGFKRTLHVIQTDSSGTHVIDERWAVSKTN